VAPTRSARVRRTTSPAQGGSSEHRRFPGQRGSTAPCKPMVERVRSAVESAATVAKVTVSAGIATSLGDRCAGESLMAAADEALYESKRAGRDRVTLASVSEAFVPPAAAEPATVIL
jgi:hypothetical protein